jgi:hypothetical protein
VLGAVRAPLAQALNSPAEPPHEPIGPLVQEDDLPPMTTLANIAAQAPSGLSAARLSSDALSFCHREHIATELGLALDLVRQCFAIIGDPAVNLVQDPELDRTYYLVIEIQVRGGVKETVSAHKRFALEASQRLGSKREMILLHYEMI